ncbi:hypothetical protein VUJ49_25295 [Pseudomonas berkeleyensis]|uniref:Uncharacterized protein n=1 Tax=Pseudomonas berkeleyensis TaxID=2726956 RepID=A0A7G5DNE5_9PSED|nr:hypothetical protein [Pseudomonas berkeleyensis]QMV63270.1 hypothetical protein HS968_25195 [Pseudomonas berkeleyensis]WSO38727.1 hypothetical protein VUJ49_25295 [Pseudomonas berkeleyensis]
MLKLDLCLSAERPVMNLRSGCVVHGGVMRIRELAALFWRRREGRTGVPNYKDGRVAQTRCPFVGADETKCF